MSDLLLMGDHPAKMLAGEVEAIGLDSETTGLRWEDRVIGISLGWQESGAYKSCYLLDAYGTGQIPMWGVAGTISSDDVIRAIPKARVVAMANHSFDFRFLMKQYGLRPMANVVEIQHVARHLAPQPLGVSLETLRGKYVGTVPKDYADMKSKRGSLAKMDAEIVAQYAREDALGTLQIYDNFKNVPALSLYKRNHIWDQRFMYLIMQLVERGIPLDLDHIKNRIKTYRRRMIELGTHLVSQGISNPNYAKDVMGYAISKGIPLANTQAETLEELDLDRYPDLSAVIEYRQLSKALGSWLEVMEKHGEWDQRLHSLLNPFGTRSYRMSSEDPNAQGIPMEARGNRAFGSMFGIFKSPDPSVQIWALDIKQAELRLAATVSRDESLLAAVSDSTDDPYNNLARVIWNDTAKRYMAKRALLSAIYEVGKVKFAATNGISENEALSILTTIRKRFPTAMSTAKAMARATEQTGMVMLATNRPRWIQQDEKGHEYKAFNQYVQGNLAEVMREAMLRIEDRLPNRLILQVHDSVAMLLDADKDAREKQFAIVQECLTSTVQDILGKKYDPAPFPIDPKPYQFVDS